MDTAGGFQGSLLPLLESSEPFDRAFGDLTRHELARGAWVDRQPGWVRDADDLFFTVLDALEWREGVERIRGEEVARPRLVASFPTSEIPDGLGVFQEMSDALSAHYGVALERITCNLYRDGRDSVAWHGDRVARELREATVAIVSLGEARPFRLRPKGGGPSMGWKAGHGDLIAMGGSCQRTWDHSIPKVSSAGPRIAVMFRHFYVWG
ncbi:MAG: alpha-ketoglutarate-dependent dioxygenase AlkB [Acidimicrobiia bacterium]